MLKLLILFTLSLSPYLTNAAMVCPPNSCNPYNGCTSGCVNQSASGSADCSMYPEQAEALAIDAASRVMAQRCYRGYFLTSGFSISIQNNFNSCTLTARAQFSCYK